MSVVFTFVFLGLVWQWDEFHVGRPEVTVRRQKELENPTQPSYQVLIFKR